MALGKILLIDDEPAFCELASLWLTNSGYEVMTAGQIDKALTLLKRFNADLVLLDLSLPPEFSPQLTLSKLPEFGSRPVIIITGHADRELALEAISQGAWDFIAKPIDPDLLEVVVKRAVSKRFLEKELKQIKQQVKQEKDASAFIGCSSNALQVRALIERIAPTDVRVLVTGPSGTGKEVISRTLHSLSLRADKPFVSVHCGAIPADLLESELFGYTKGAFTGADKDKKGLLSLANNGTLFLDEIGEMPLPMQVKLLRVLQEGTYFPIGGRVEQHIDVRVISATNADLVTKIEEGEFREDLYYRIKGVNIETQPLSQRLEDVSVLVPNFLQQLSKSHKQTYFLSSDAFNWFRLQPWPGNVRELKNALDSVVSIARDGEVTLSDIALLYPNAPVTAGEGMANNASLEDASFIEESENVFNVKKTAAAVDLTQTMEQQVKQLEIQLIYCALEQSQGNRSQAARQLGLSRQGLLKKIERYELDVH
ncbi:sigma-54-dependent transcriptional regulator [Marinomonas sp. 2405UD68-3]|uniref:sigma-54-dependent transcriptional regulator n=1 Tax=Marinomonas sp. 2405UD68-3 TaxID=3391835 RepID=UPI0039C94D82